MKFANQFFAIAGLLLLYGIAAAQGAAAVNVNIPSQSMVDALSALANQTGIQLIYKDEGVRAHEMVAPAVVGSMTAEVALQKLFANSALKYMFINEHTVAISRIPELQSEGAATGDMDATVPASGQMQVAQARESVAGTAVNHAVDEPSIASKEKDIGDDEVVVTGSHIRGTSVNGASPVIVFDKEAIEKTGVATLQQFFEKLPQNFGGGANPINVASNGIGRDTSSSGLGAGLNIRGMGAGTTLTLLNGRRITASNQFQYVDVSLIPMSAVDRIEVLTDGASAIYGSDAIGGVVNIVLRQDFDGYETQLRYGGVTAGSMKEYQFAQTAGWAWGQGHALLSYEYLSQDNLGATDKDFSRNSPFQPFDLSPQSDRHSVYLSGEQQLNPVLSIEAGGNYAKRDVDGVATTTAGEQYLTPTTEQYDVFAGIKLDLPGGWQARLNGAFGESNVELEFNRISTAGVRTTTHPSTFSKSKYADFAADGRMFSLPAGAVKTAVGASYRQDTYNNNSGSLTAPVIVTDARNVASAFAETIIPIVGRAQQLPAVSMLELTAAVRYDRYSDFGSSTNPKFGLAWETVPGVVIRGTYGRSFRAPLFQDLSPINTSVTVFNLPNTASPTGRTITMVAGGGNAGLQAENAKTWTAGLALNPAWLDDFSLELNYYNIEYADRIDSGFPGNVTTIWAQAAPYASIITQNPTIDLIHQLRALGLAGTQFQVFRTGPFAVPANLNEDNAQAVLDNRLRNNAVANQDGIDMNTDYRFTLGASRLRVGLAGQYLIDSTRRVTRESPLADVLNQAYLPVDLKFRASVDIVRGGWVAAVFLNYVDNYKDPANPANTNIEAWKTVDLNLQYKVPEGAAKAIAGTSLILGIQNLLDRDPPFVLTSRGGPFDPANANPLGRFVSLAVTRKW